MVKNTFFINYIARHGCLTVLELFPGSFNLDANQWR